MTQTYLIAAAGIETMQLMVSDGEWETQWFSDDFDVRQATIGEMVQLLGSERGVKLLLWTRTLGSRPRRGSFPHVRHGLHSLTYSRNILK